MVRIHPTSDVQTKHIGDGTIIWQFVVILPNAVVGNNCNVNCNVFIENAVIIGDNVTIKPGVQIWDGITIGDNVFIGPNVTFTNDIHPRSQFKNWKLSPTVVRLGASIGANSTIIAGCDIGEYSFIGAGSVITKSTAPFSLWYGNPARQRGFVTREGIVLDLNLKSKDGNFYFLKNGEPLL